MALPTSDPRVFFAAERTLLSWVRTGITIMALGFVISRFSLFVQLLAMQSAAGEVQTPSILPTVLGVGFILIGSIAIVFSSIQHKRFIETLPIPDLPTGYSKRFAVSLSLLIGGLGFALSGYLAVSGA